MDRPVIDYAATTVSSQHLRLVWSRLPLGWKTKGVTILWGVAFLVTWFAMTLIYAGAMEKTWQQLLNSDLLMPFMVMRDVLRDPATITQWEFAPAIYAFPDWILAGVLQASPLPRKWLPLVYGGCLLATSGFCIGWTLVEMRTARWAQAILWGTMIVAAVFLSSNLTRHGFGGNCLKWICAPFIHSGSIFSGLLFIPLLAQVFHGEGRGQLRSAYFAAALTAAACYSDLSFVAWFAAPTCIAFLITPAHMAFWLKARTIVVLAAIGGVAAALDRFLRSSSTAISGLPRDSMGSVNVWLDVLRQSINQGQWQLWLPVGLTFLMLPRAVMLTCSPRNRRQARPDSLELAIIFSSIASFVVPIIMGLVFNRSLLRYHLPVLILPYIWLLALASRWNSPRLRPFLSAAAVIFWLGCSALIPRGFAAIERISQSQTVSNALLSLGQRAGYGDYWTAKQTMFETNYAVHCLQLNPLGERQEFGYNTSWFDRRADDGKEVLPTFVVMTRLNEGVVRKLFGDPDTIKNFQDEIIWLYDKPLPLITKSNPSDLKNTIFTKGEYVGIGVTSPDTALHVARSHPDLLKLQNLAKGGASWLLQVGGNGFQDGNLMISHRPSGKYALVVEPTGKVVVMGDLHVGGTLTNSAAKNKPPDDATATATAAELRKQVDSLISIVEELLERVGDLEDAAVAAP